MLNVRNANQRNHTMIGRPWERASERKRVSRPAFSTLRLFYCVLGVLLCDNSLAPAQEVVATVGRFSITTKDLLDSYEFGPAFVKRQAHPLRKHLEFMIDDRLLALEAERLKYDTTAFVRNRVSSPEEDLTVDQFYQHEVLSNVKLRGKKEFDGHKATTNLRLRWILSTEKHDTEQISR